MRPRRARFRWLHRRLGRRGRVLVAVAAVSLLLGFALGFLGVGQQARQAARAPATADAGGGPALGQRAIWVVRHMLRTPESVDQVLALAQDVGADTLFVQVNGRMEAYYASALLPPAQDAAPGFDALAYLLPRAKAAGLRVHAWINAFTAGMLTDWPQHPDHVLNRHPEWVTVDRSGRSLLDYSWQEAQALVPARMLDPGVPEVQRFVADMVLEVVDRYDVDGVHLDYVRYPSRRFGYHPESLRRFAAEHGFDPQELEQNAVAFAAAYGRDELLRRLALWDEWRRAQVTQLVARLAEELARRPRPVFLSVAAGADAADAVGERLQDWPGWMERRLVDAVVVMAYNADTERFVAHVAEAVALGRRFGVPVYAGVGAYLLGGDGQLLRRQLEVARQAGAAGVAVFSYDTLAEEPGLRAALRAAWRGEPAP